MEIKSETEKEIIESSSDEEQFSSIQSGRSNSTFLKPPVKDESYFKLSLIYWEATSSPVTEIDL